MPGSFLQSCASLPMQEMGRASPKRLRLPKVWRYRSPCSSSARIELVSHLAHPRNDSGRPPSRPTSQSPSEQPLPPHPSRHNGRGASYMTSISDQNPFRRDDHRGADHTLPPPPYSTYNPFVPRPNFEGRPPDQGELPSNNVTNFCDSPSSRPWIGGGSSRSALEEQPTIELMSTGYIDSPNLNQVGDGGFIIHSNPRTSPSDGGYREGTVTQESVDRWTRSLTAMFTEDSSNSIRPSPPSSSNGDETNPFQMPYGNGFAQTISLNDIDI